MIVVEELSYRNNIGEINDGGGWDGGIEGEILHLRSCIMKST